MGLLFLLMADGFADRSHRGICDRLYIKFCIHGIYCFGDKTLDAVI